MDIKKSATELADLLDNRRRHLQSRATRRLWRVRRDVAARRIDGRLQTLGRLDDWTAPLEDRKVLDRLAQWVDSGLARAVDTGIDGYDEMTVKAISAIVRELGDVAQLHRISRYEAAHKGRKTVASAVARRLEQLEPDVVAWKPWELDLFSQDDPTEAAA